MSCSQLQKEISKTIKKINKALKQLKGGDNSEEFLDELGRLQEHANDLMAKAKTHQKT